MKKLALPPAQPFFLSDAGWLFRNGKRVTLEQVTHYDRDEWGAGEPIGPLLHEQAGCGDPFSAFEDRHVSAAFTVLQGTRFPVPVRQYCNARHPSYHAYSAAFYYIGIESAVLHGACNQGRAMAETIAALAAACMDAAERWTGKKIPTARSFGGAFTPGVKCHADGLAPNATWDPNGHWDAPFRATGDPIAQWVSAGERAALDRNIYTAAEFIGRIAYYRGEDDVALTDAEKAALQFAQRFEDGVTRAQKGKRRPQAGTVQRIGFDAAKASAERGAKK